METEEMVTIRGRDAIGHAVAHDILPRAKVEAIVDRLNWDDVVSLAYLAQSPGVAGVAYLDLRTGEVKSAQYIGSEQNTGFWRLELIRFDENFDAFDSFDVPEGRTEREAYNALIDTVWDNREQILRDVYLQLDEIYARVVPKE